MGTEIQRINGETNKETGGGRDSNAHKLTLFFCSSSSCPISDEIPSLLSFVLIAAITIHTIGRAQRLYSYASQALSGGQWPP
jgi:hypothetical protein